MHNSTEHHRILIVGGGPAGLQMSYFLKQGGYDHLVLEQSDRPANAFVKYPRHRKLISINKKFNYFKEPDFNMRHDWNSLLTNDYSLKMTDYSDEIFPCADKFVEYCRDFYQKYNLDVRFHTRVVQVKRRPQGVCDGPVFTVQCVRRSHDGRSLACTFTCDLLLMATGCTGAFQPREIDGWQHADTYEGHSLDVSRYVDKRVLIVGGGNSGFETADHLAAHAAIIHVALKRPVRHAWDSHFVGDLRAVNNNLLDMYQLKSLHATLGDPPTSITPTPAGTFHVAFHEYLGDIDVVVGEVPLTREYDAVILCTGVRWVDLALFHPSNVPRCNSSRQKYPALTSSYESVNVPGLYFLGANMQARDRKAASGFIHGFRYLVRSLYQHLVRTQLPHLPPPPAAATAAVASPPPPLHDRNPPSCLDLMAMPAAAAASEGQPADNWGPGRQELEHITSALLSRYTTVSSLFQCFGVLCDVLLVTPNATGGGQRGEPKYSYRLHTDVITDWALEQLQACGRATQGLETTGGAGAGDGAADVARSSAAAGLFEPGAQYSHVFVITLQFNFSKYPKTLSSSNFIQDSGTVNTACGAFLHPVMQHYSDVCVPLSAAATVGGAHSSRGGISMEEFHLFETLDLRFTNQFKPNQSLSTLNHVLLTDQLNHYLQLTQDALPPLRKITSASTPAAEKRSLFKAHMGLTKVWSEEEMRAWREKVERERELKAAQVQCRLFPLPISKL